MEVGSSPETKRPRLPSKTSPNPKQSPIPKKSEPRPTEPPTQPIAPSQPAQSTPPTVHSPTTEPKATTDQQNDHTPHTQTSAEHQRATIRVAYQRLQTVDMTIKTREREIAEAERVGDHARLTELRRIQEKDKMVFSKLRDALMRAAASTKHNETTAPPKPQEAVQSAPLDAPSGSGLGSSPPKPIPPAPSVAGTSRTRTPSQTQPPLAQVPMVPSGTPSQLAAQMQKLVDQRNRTPRMSAGSIPHEQPPPSAVQPGAGRPPPEWKGILSWKGTDPMSGQRREMQTWVALKLSPQADNV